MFLPLHDGVALLHLKRATATITFVLVNIAVYLAETSGVAGNTNSLEIGLGLIPAVMSGNAIVSPELSVVPAWTTPVTSTFLHGGFLHLAGNMMFLWVFGDNVEDAMGSLRFAAFYLLCGAIAGLTYVFMFPASESPLIGASGAISGVAAAYLVLHPRVRIFGLLLNWIPAAAPAYVLIGLWIAYQIFFALSGGDSQIGWWAHVGGIAAGLVLLPVFRHWRPAPPNVDL
ncbi:MAG: rhomboid family intramembrane serine protease [Beijerinckiaceae bacterium]